MEEFLDLSAYPPDDLDAHNTNNGHDDDVPPLEQPEHESGVDLVEACEIALSEHVEDSSAKEAPQTEQFIDPRELSDNQPLSYMANGSEGTRNCQVEEKEQSDQQSLALSISKLRMYFTNTSRLHRTVTDDISWVQKSTSFFIIPEEARWNSLKSVGTDCSHDSTEQLKAQLSSILVDFHNELDKYMEPIIQISLTLAQKVPKVETDFELAVKRERALLSRIKEEHLHHLQTDPTFRGMPLDLCLDWGSEMILKEGLIPIFQEEMGARIGYYYHQVDVDSLLTQGFLQTAFNDRQNQGITNATVAGALSQQSQYQSNGNKDNMMEINLIDHAIQATEAVIQDSFDLFNLDTNVFSRDLLSIIDGSSLSQCQLINNPFRDRPGVIDKKGELLPVWLSNLLANQRSSQQVSQLLHTQQFQHLPQHNLPSCPAQSEIDLLSSLPDSDFHCLSQTWFLLHQQESLPDPIQLSKIRDGTYSYADLDQLTDQGRGLMKRYLTMSNIGKLHQSMVEKSIFKQIWQCVMERVSEDVIRRSGLGGQVVCSWVEPSQDYEEDDRMDVTDDEMEDERDLSMGDVLMMAGQKVFCEGMKNNLGDQEV